MAIVLLYRLMMSAQQAYGGLFLTNVVDDVSFAVAGTERFVVHSALGTVELLTTGFA